MRREPFRLTKWYLDVAGSDRSAAIGYWASLSYRALSVVWQSVARYVPGQPPQRTWSLARTPAPYRTGTALDWESAPLHSTFRVQTRHSAIVERLWSDDAKRANGGGSVDWHCEVPGGCVRVELSGGSTMVGAGYAERLTMTVPPWRLPLRELRWGRWCDASASRTLVWIDWRGAAPRRWVYLDGHAIEATVDDTSVTGPDFRLTLSRRMTLEHHALDDIVQAIPGLSKLIPRSMRNMCETKWLSDGTLSREGAAALTGQTIHETVNFG